MKKASKKPISSKKEQIGKLKYDIDALPMLVLAFVAFGAGVLFMFLAWPFIRLITFFSKEK